jgi:tetratricopeptide (TPR) repeat protein
MSSLRNPLGLLSRERLSALQGRLAAGGTFVLWLPLARMSESALLQILATVDLTFGGFDVYVCGPDALVVAGRRRPHYARLRAHFADAARRSWMQNGDYWEPVELLADFATEAQDLRPVTELAGALSVLWPARPPRLGRDLAAPRSPVAPASILQNRLMDPQRLLSRVTFQSEKQRYVALRGFPTYYRTMTRRLLQRLAGEDEAHQRQLIGFLQGPHARLDLLAPQADTRLMQLADAMLTFGMPGRSVELLEDAADSGREDFALRSRLGKALADANQYKEALEHYRRALELRPGSVETMRRIAALLLQTGSFGEGAEMLRRVIEREPENTVDLLMLATLDARMGNLDEAERLASRVLRLDPDNADAQALVELARQGSAPSGGNEAPELPAGPAYQRGQR